MSNAEIIFLLLVCHCLGDYVLQTDYIAKEKGKNLWILTVHSLLYTLPFYVFFGFHWPLLGVFITHWIIDLPGMDKMPNWFDQLLHMVVLVLYFISM